MKIKLKPHRYLDSEADQISSTYPIESYSYQRVLHPRQKHALDIDTDTETGTDTGFESMHFVYTDFVLLDLVTTHSNPTSIANFMNLQHLNCCTRFRGHLITIQGAISCLAEKNHYYAHSFRPGYIEIKAQ